MKPYSFGLITTAISYKNHRFPPYIIARAVWLKFRFPLSLRLVEEMLLERGIVVSYETIRRWARNSVPPMPGKCAARSLHAEMFEFVICLIS
jgi:transposase-like protein